MVTVCLTSNEMDTRLAKTDTEIGIAAEQLPYLFDPFVQIEDSVDRSWEGLGVGLPLVEALCGLHRGVGGEQGPRTGATFEASIPLDSGALAE